MEPPTGAQPPSPPPSQREQELERRLAAIEARLAVLEEHVPKETAATLPTGTKQVDDSADTYWALTELSLRNNAADNTGAVMFAGHVTTSEQEATYQWTRPHRLLPRHQLGRPHDTPYRAGTSGARNHPPHASRRPTTAAQLAENNVVTSTGTAYHHLNALMAAGWIRQETYRGIQYSHQQDRPLLTILACCEDH